MKGETEPKIKDQSVINPQIKSQQPPAKPPR